MYGVVLVLLQHVFDMMPQNLLQNISIDITPDRLTINDSDRPLVTFWQGAGDAEFVHMQQLEFLL